MTKQADTRLRRKKRIRKRLSGSNERPRLTVFRSAKHVYAQLVDDDAGETLAATSSLDAALRGDAAAKAKTDIAKAVGLRLAELVKAKGVERVVFDRNGFIYHGRVRAVAEGAREGGLQF